MIRVDQPDGWIVFYDDDGAAEIGRVRPPTKFSMSDLEQFIDSLRREIVKKENGPS